MSQLGECVWAGCSAHVCTKTPPSGRPASRGAGGGGHSGLKGYTQPNANAEQKW